MPYLRRTWRVRVNAACRGATVMRPRCLELLACVRRTQLYSGSSKVRYQRKHPLLHIAAVCANPVTDTSSALCQRGASGYINLEEACLENITPSAVFSRLACGCRTGDAVHSQLLRCVMMGGMHVTPAGAVTCLCLERELGVGRWFTLNIADAVDDGPGHPEAKGISRRP